MQTQSTSPNPIPLEQLLNRGTVWQARRGADTQAGCGESTPLSTGYPELDRQLVGTGWQPGNLVEVLYDDAGSGELRLLLPLLASQSHQEGWSLWVDPPHIPYAPALAAAGVKTDRLLMVRSRTIQDRLWTLEQALKGGSCSSVLGWLPAGEERGLRRLQVAASEGRSLGFLFRPAACREQSSSAPYRLWLEPQPQGVGITLIKRKQGWAMPQQILSLGEEELLGDIKLTASPTTTQPPGLKLVKRVN